MFNTILISQYLASLKKRASIVQATEDPWGGKKDGHSESDKKDEDKNQPPDLDEFFSKLIKKKSNNNQNGGDKKPSFEFNFNFNGKILAGIIALIVAIWLSTGFYTVNQRENGVVTFFGKYEKTTEAGLNWRWPSPIGSVEKVDIQSINTMKIGEYSKQNSSVSTAVQREGQMLTKDENIVEISAAVQYRVSNPELYLYASSDPVAVLNDIVTSAIREVVGANSVDDVLKDKRTQWPQQAKSIIDDTLAKYNLGVEVVAFELQDARAPSEVQDAFQDAVRAREDEQRYRLEAESYAKERLPIARGKSAQILQEAQAYEAQVTEKALGESSRFTALLNAYSMAPEVMEKRLYLDTMNHVLNNSKKVVLANDQIKPIVNVSQQPVTAPVAAADHETKKTTVSESPSASSSSSTNKSSNAQEDEDSRGRNR